jgi:hypothetical protein
MPSSGTSASLGKDCHLRYESMDLVDNASARASRVTGCLPVSLYLIRDQLHTLDLERVDIVIAPLHDSLSRNVATMISIRLETSAPMLFIGRRGDPLPATDSRDSALAVLMPFSLEELFDAIARLVLPAQSCRCSAASAVRASDPACSESTAAVQ